MPEDVSYFDWENLICSLQDRQAVPVIPIIGSELLQIELDSGLESLDRYLARVLSQRLRIDPARLSPHCSLNEVAWHYLLEQRGNRAKLYSTIRTLLKAQRLSPPKALRQLAEITDFSLYVTTSFDMLMEATLDEIRFQGRPGTKSHSYSLRNNKKIDSNELDDLSTHPGSANEPAVFHLLGSVASQGDFVVTDEDALEFLYALQAGRGRPENLFDRLCRSHLLLIGCNFPDWLTRFFLRLLSNNRMAENRSRIEYIADQSTPTDPVLGMFLRNAGVTLFEGSSAVEFVDELYTHWKEMCEREREVERESLPVECPSVPASSQSCPGSVFLSYANEDRAAVMQLKTSLESAGIRIWLDQRRLEPGDDYDREIREAIDRCTLFFPCISSRALEAVRKPPRRYFQEEWSVAINDMNMGWRSYPFIWPILLDDTHMDDKQIPPALRKLHMQACPTGAPLPEFIDLLKSKLTQHESERSGQR